MNCKRGGFTFLRHNELRDITAELLTEVCPDVMIEPPLQPLSGECFNYRSAKIDDNARADIATTGFWSPLHRSFFDVRVFNPFASTYSRSKLKACHRRNELKNAVSTMRESGQLNMDHSHHSFSLQPEGWGNLPLHFTNSLPHQFQTASLNLTQQSSTGSAAAYPSLS